MIHSENSSYLFSIRMWWKNKENVQTYIWEKFPCVQILARKKEKWKTFYFLTKKKEKCLQSFQKIKLRLRFHTAVIIYLKTLKFHLSKYNKFKFVYLSWKNKMKFPCRKIQNISVMRWHMHVWRKNKKNFILFNFLYGWLT